jgi:uncharacterized protein (TIGR03435 family)
MSKPFARNIVTHISRTSMVRTIIGASLVVMSACAAFAQSATPPPSFEVASIKPAAPLTPGKVMIGVRRDPGRVTYSGMPLKEIIRNAYRVKTYQISGPAWLDSERFDIMAKLPDGATEEQVPEMMQALLAERFGLKLHRETKELPVYTLVVGKNGPKLEEVEAPPPPPTAPPPPGAAEKPIARGMQMSDTTRGTMMRFEPGGKFTAQRMSISNFADMLSRFLDRPVVDETGLKGYYNFTLEVSMEDLVNMKGMFRMMGPPGGPEGGAARPESGPAPESAPSASLFQSVQKLGLKLEPRKSPIEFLVIDHVEKVPTEN